MHSSQLADSARLRAAGQLETQLRHRGCHSSFNWLVVGDCGVKLQRCSTGLPMPGMAASSFDRSVSMSSSHVIFSGGIDRGFLACTCRSAAANAVSKGRGRTGSSH